MKLTWLQKLAIQKLLGTDRGNRVIAVVESDWFNVAVLSNLAALGKALTALFNKDLAGFIAALPEDYKSLFKGTFVVGAPGTRAVGLIDKLDGKGYVAAITPKQRAAVNEALTIHATLPTA
ncbi:MAG: hypothetical protein EON58_14720 [Alphaproteobacteria bacterium]|nr:MAG: hypothetical protein EON58_14720 [Alphaproteobacteria bacterium]